MLLATTVYQALMGKNIVMTIQHLSIPPFNNLATPVCYAAIQGTWQKNKE
jgi:hypothetical protein